MYELAPVVLYELMSRNSRRLLSLRIIEATVKLYDSSMENYRLDRLNEWHITANDRDGGFAYSESWIPYPDNGDNEGMTIYFHPRTGTSDSVTTIEVNEEDIKDFIEDCRTIVAAVEEFLASYTEEL